MRILTYVDGVLTIIRENEYFSGIFEKPLFITGASFYYEPTQQIMDNKNLTEELINTTEEFITNFDFNSSIIITPVKFYVDEIGNYKGVDYVEGYIEVKETPIDNSLIYDFITETFYEALVISTDGDTLTDLKSFKNGMSYYYIKKIPYDLEVPIYCQNYNKSLNVLEINITLYKVYLKSKINLDWLESLKSSSVNFGGIINSVQNSWLRQELEAKNYIQNNLYPTPYIDSILSGRNSKLEELGKTLETKEILINKILVKVESYYNTYGVLLGKLDIILNLIEETNDLESLKKIKL